MVEKINRKTNADFWRRWWNSRSREIPKGYRIDRLTSFHDEVMEQISEKEFLDFVSPEENDVVFDAGCGTGIDIVRLHAKVRSIIGMDQSEGMIDECKNRIKQENIQNVSLIVGNISNVEVKSNTFDKIICRSVFHYLNDEECNNTLKEFVRISKDGAIIVFHVKNLFSLYLTTLLLMKKVKRIFTKNVIFENYRSYKWYGKKLSALGIEVLDFNSVNKFNIDILPNNLFIPLQKIERIFYKNRLLRKYGADFFIKAKVSKLRNIDS